MSKFRKKPVVIEARQFGGVLDASVATWCGGTIQESPVGITGGILCIPTLEGTMTATVGDWIIRGVKGEFYPCKPDIFAATYEPVEP